MGTGTKLLAVAAWTTNRNVAATTRLALDSVHRNWLIAEFL
jgi:hypothetical protein